MCAKLIYKEGESRRLLGVLFGVLLGRKLNFTQHYSCQMLEANLAVVLNFQLGAMLATRL